MGTDKLTHGAEFELIHDQITLYQRELAHTWLWAVIPAGAVYTWLSLNRLKLDTLDRLVWFIPACFVALCSIRYVLFWLHLSGLVAYLHKLEEDAFGAIRNGKPEGIARYNKKHTHPTALFVGACLVWLIIFGCCSYLSWKLPEAKMISQTNTAPVK